MNDTNIKAVLAFGFELYNTKDVFQGGFHPERFPAHILPLYQTAEPAIGAAPKVLTELSTMDDAMVADLVAFVVAKGVANEHAADVIDKSLKAAVAAYNLVKAIQA